MNRINRMFFYLEKLGLKKTIKFIIITKYFRVKISNYQKYLDLFSNKSGLEIGGPTNYFNSDNILPIYSVVKSLDGVNFSTYTIWEGFLSKGETFKYDRATKIGYQYICDAIDLNLIPSEKYDFVISCNNLEHIANPLKAIREWLRVLKCNSLLFLVLPNNEINFDHNRDISNLKHLISDYDGNTLEDDMSHLDEILKLNDLFLDPKAGTLTDFKERSMKNFENRALHHHVFNMNLLVEIYDYFNIEIILKYTTVTDHFILGRKR